MNYVIPDRQSVAQLKYQLRRFRKQCVDLPENVRQRIDEAMMPLAELLAAQIEEEYPGQFDDPDYVGYGCRGLGLDHRWQTSEFSDKRFCTKCGEPESEEADANSR